MIKCLWELFGALFTHLICDKISYQRQFLNVLKENLKGAVFQI